MPISRVSARRAASPKKALHVSARAKAVASAFQQQLPSLAKELIGRHHEIAGTTGNEKNGSVTVRYALKDDAAAKTSAKNLQSEWIWDDENMVGDNVAMPKNTLLSSFSARADGNHVNVRLHWKPDAPTP